MCFSATASFTLSAGLLPLGGWCVQKAWRGDRRFLPLAAFPLAFGMQQAIEGLVWLGLGANDAVLVSRAATGFVFFSHGFWLFWTPFMVFMLEERPRLRQFWRFLAGFGLLYGLYIILPVVAHPDWLTVGLNHRSLDYTFHLLIQHPWLIQAGPMLYVFTILAPLLLTANPAVQGMGWLVLGSLLVTTQIFQHGFISIWCFFAAIASLYIGYLFFHDIEAVSRSPQIREL